MWTSDATHIFFREILTFSLSFSYLSLTDSVNSADNIYICCSDITPKSFRCSGQTMASECRFVPTSTRAALTKGFRLLSKSSHQFSVDSDCVWLYDKIVAKCHDAPKVEYPNETVLTLTNSRSLLIIEKLAMPFPEAESLSKAGAARVLLKHIFWYQKEIESMNDISTLY